MTIILRTYHEYHDRQAAWCAATGLKESTASVYRVLKFLDRWPYPRGFDHTMVFYHRAERFHIAMTEPYHTTEQALESVALAAKTAGAAFAFVSPGTERGMWSPGHCYPLLIGPYGKQAMLDGFAALLPTFKAIRQEC